ncbi:MAG: hypothetical protein ACK5H2_09405 [Beutenbergiaceae bacterium]
MTRWMSRPWAAALCVFVLLGVTYLGIVVVQIGQNGLFDSSPITAAEAILPVVFVVFALAAVVLWIIAAIRRSRMATRLQWTLVALAAVFLPVAVLAIAIG